MTSEQIKKILDYIGKPEVKDLKAIEYKKWIFYNGNTKPIIKEAIQKEFKKAETVNELSSRLLPLNILRKIIDKLAQVYLETPVRNISDQNEQDGELLEAYEDAMQINVKMKEANSLFKLFKKLLIEIYVDEEGTPSIRPLPPHTYYAISNSSVSPEKPDTIIKVLEFNEDPTKARYLLWTKEEVVEFTGNGVIVSDPGNPGSLNPYGVLPFAYVADSSISTEPVPDDDLFSSAIAIPIILTDLSFGIKYQAWSLIYTIGYSGDLPSGPNGVVHMEAQPDGTKPEIGQLKPNIDIDGTLKYIESVMSYLLTSRGLKSDTISGSLTASNVSSGVSKAIDSSELIEDKKNQYNVFYSVENQIWNALIKNIIPVWRRIGSIKPELNKEFTTTASVVIQFKEPKVVITETEMIKTSKDKIDNGFSTTKRELYNIYPDYSEDEIDQLMIEIEQEEDKKREKLVSGMMPEEGAETNGVESQV